MQRTHLSEENILDTVQEGSLSLVHLLLACVIASVIGAADLMRPDEDTSVTYSSLYYVVGTESLPFFFRSLCY
jgi:hypothetical protein